MHVHTQIVIRVTLQLYNVMQLTVPGAHKKREGTLFFLWAPDSTYIIDQYIYIYLSNPVIFQYIFANISLKIM